MTDPKLDALLDAALPHVAFDGWSDATFQAAIEDCGVDPAIARGLCPRRGVDLAKAYHRRGDAAMIARLRETDLSGMRFRDRIAFAVRARLETVKDPELVRRGMTLFALPQNAAEGAALIWETAGLIWTELGDTSQDVNWYTKRATLSGVYSATLLFWLGDESAGKEASWAFLDRRIENVMQFEKTKAAIRDNKAISGLLAGPLWLVSQIKAPSGQRRDDVPGQTFRR